jgi:hypothetical protein
VPVLEVDGRRLDRVSGFPDKEPKVVAQDDAVNRNRVPRFGRFIP